MRKVSFKMVKMHPSEEQLRHSHKCNAVIKLIPCICGFHSFLFKTSWYWQSQKIASQLFDLGPWGGLTNPPTSLHLGFSTPRAELASRPVFSSFSQMTAQCSPRASGVMSLSSQCPLLHPIPQHDRLGAATLLHLLSNGDELTGN